MLRNLIAALVLVGAVATPMFAERLKVGDAVPKLTVQKFIKGNAVTQFDKGTIYVIEFWSTWCHPCRAAIPHLTELQKKYRDVVFVGVSVAEQEPSKVDSFVKDMGAKMDYRVAIDLIPADQKATEGAMVRNWLVPAGEEAIPTVFIVDGAGKIAWIGDIGEMEEPLESIRSGKWDANTFLAERTAGKLIEKVGGSFSLNAENKSIETMNLGRTRVTDADLKELKGMNRLQELHLSGTRVTDTGLRELTGLKKLQLLYLGGTRISDAGLKELKELKGLHQLKLEHTRVTDEGLKELQGLKGLQQLDISGCSKVTKSGLNDLKKSLPKLSIAGREDLQLPEAEGIAYRAVEKLGGQLNIQNKAVAAVEFRNTALTDAQLKKLLKEFKQFKRLQSLILAGSARVTDTSLKELPKELKELENLRVLYLGGTGITDVGLKELKELKGLQELGLGRTKVTDTGLKEIKHLEKLRVLFLFNTRVTDEGLKELKGLKGLKKLYVAGCSKVTNAGVADLKKALPKLQIER